MSFAKARQIGMSNFQREYNNYLRWRYCNSCNPGALCDTKQVIGNCPIFVERSNRGKEKESMG